MGKVRGQPGAYGTLLFAALSLLALPVSAERPQPEGAPQTSSPATTRSSTSKGEARETGRESTPARDEGQAANGPEETGNDSEDEPASQLTQQEREARDAFFRGDTLYLEGDYEGAVEAFEEAYAKSGHIEMLFNLANAHERLGHYSEAAFSLRGYIPHSPETNRPALERRLARLERLAEQRKAEERNAREKAVSETSEPLSWNRAMGVGLITLGGAGVVTGIGFAISAAKTRGELNDVCQDGASGRLCPPAADNLLARDKHHSLIADIAFVGGAVFATTGVFLLLRAPHEAKTEVSATMGWGSVSLRGTF